MSQTALDLIKGALRRINSYQHGETIAQPDQADLLEAINDVLDSWSNDKLYVFGTNENILQWNPGQNQYKVGNPLCTDLGEPPFIGILTQGSNFITGVTNVPADLMIGATVTDFQNLIPPGQTVTAIGAAAISFGPGVASQSSVGAEQITYSIPGDFAIPRPLRITGGYTRINRLDFWLDCYGTQEQYTQILYKAQPGPWPTIAWYNMQMPYGILNVYQTPGQAAELHLFTDTLLKNLSLTQTFILPQGYARAIKANVAVLVWPEYWGAVPVPGSLTKEADVSLSLIKALNAQPPARAKYDRMLVRGNRIDGGWIIHGGYNS
jgi:hypothetical protein